MDNFDLGEITPISFSIHEVFNGRYYIETRAKIDANDVKPPEVHGADKNKKRDPNLKPGKQVGPKLVPQIDQNLVPINIKRHVGRGGIKRKYAYNIA